MSRAAQLRVPTQTGGSGSDCCPCSQYFSHNPPFISCLKFQTPGFRTSLLARFQYQAVSTGKAEGAASPWTVVNASRSWSGICGPPGKRPGALPQAARGPEAVRRPRPAHASCTAAQLQLLGSSPNPADRPETRALF